jgi:hypothetical protein
MRSVSAAWRRAAAAAAVGASLLCSACALSPAAPQAADAWQRCELFFGLSIPGGGQVSAEQWQAFVDREITPRFPQGLTVLQAQGQWRNAQGGIDREASRVLVLLLPAEAARGPLMDELRSRYREQFRQEAVGRACTAADVRF